MGVRREWLISLIKCARDDSGGNMKQLIADLTGPMWAWTVTWLVCFAVLAGLAFRNATILWALPPAAAIGIITIPMSRYGKTKAEIISSANAVGFNAVFVTAVLVLVFVFLRDLERRNRRNREERKRGRSDN